MVWARSVWNDPPLSPCILVFPNFTTRRWLILRGPTVCSRPWHFICDWLRLKCDGTRAETRFCLSAKWTSPFKSAGSSVQSTTDSRGVRISSSSAGYTKFRGSEGYWLPTPFASFPFTSPPVRHRVPSRFNWTLPCTWCNVVLAVVLRT